MRNLKRALSLALASVMLLGMMVVGTSASYTDVDSKDNLEAIEVLKMVGVMTGDDKGNFNPDKMVTRNEMAVVMCNLLGLKTGGSHPFTDVPAWAAPYVAACYNNGIIAGIGANKFGGDANVTAVQAGLMVMKALGYFGYAGEFGDSWKLSVVKQADKINLYDGINAYTDQVMTRNEIAQMVLNALECTVQVVTEQGGVSVDGNGISVNVKPTYDYQNAANNSGKDYRGNNGNNTMQLCEKIYGNDLKKDTSNNTTDAFGRPATKWTYNNDSVTCPDAPDAVYTASVKGTKIYEDLGKPSTVNSIAAQADGDNTYNVPAGFAIASGNNIKIGGNGVLTEVYYDKDTKAATIVLINTYVAKVTDCDKNDDGKYDITTDDSSVGSYESDVAYAADDVVLYTKVVKSGNDEVKSMALAEKISGEVTRVKNDDSFVIAGTTYKYSAQFVGTKLPSTSVDFDTDVYLDSYGYAIMLDNTKSTTNYAVVVGVSSGTWTENNGDQEAKLLFPDGTVSVVKVDTVTGGGTLALNQIVTYTVNSSKEYTLTVKAAAINTVPSNAATDVLKVEKGKATVKVNGTDYTATGKTEFFIYNSGDKEYTTYTGIKNVSDLSAAANTYWVSFDKVGNVLKAVYVIAATDITDNTSEAATFIYVKGDEEEIKDTDLGNYYTFKAVVDGKITTVNVSSSLVTTTGAGSTFKVDGDTTADHLGYIVSKVKTNNDGIITGATIETTDLSAGTLTLNNGDGYIVDTSATVNKAKDDIITIGGVGLAYSDNVKVFEYNKADSKFVSKTISSLKDGTYNIYVQIDDSTVVGI